MPRVALAASLLMLACTPGLAAQLPASRPAARDSAISRVIDTIRVTGRIDDLIGTAATASEGRVGSAELRRRPIAREGELLETVPGLIVTQHSGEGKANQYFVRGFNLDHGTDFQTRIEGMPLNMPTHGHGQGYTDLNFLIPEFVDYLDYKLGVYHPEVGDFGSAGAAEFHLLRRVTHPFGDAEYGANGLARLTSGVSPHVGMGDLLVGGEAKRYDGPWEVKERINKYNGIARYSWTAGASELSILGLAYHNRWDANDQIPLRAVTEGLVSRFGQLDSTDGGASQRYSLSGSWRQVGSRSTQLMQLFGIYSDLTLYSNFTYFLNDPVRGDQFSQTDHRLIVGGNASHMQEVNVRGVGHTLTVGLQLRVDIIDGLGLFRTERRVRFETVRQDDVRETGTGIYARAESRWTERVRTVLGVRADGYTFHVSSDRAENSGRRHSGIVSPKASLIFTPTLNSELYVSAGQGFHSNDARGTTITVDPSTGRSVPRVDPLVRSRGGELGIRLTPLTELRTTLSAWVLDLDSELIFTGDAGATQPSAASRRRGMTLANFYRPTPQLSFDADVSFARARFAGVDSGQDHVPGALEDVLAAGVTFSAHETGVFSALRLRHFGSYPLKEDNSSRAQASNLVNADVGYQLRSGARLQLSVLNLLDTRADDIQYTYTSRLMGETFEGTNDVHFHPSEPRQVRAIVGYRF